MTLTWWRAATVLGWLAWLGVAAGLLWQGGAGLGGP